MSNKRKEEESLFRQKYLDYIAKNGDPFELSEVAFNDDDLRKVRNFFYWMIGLFFISDAIFFFALIFKFPHGEDIFFAGMLALLLIVMSIWSVTKRREMLERNVKPVIKGIITQRGMSGKYSNVQISMKEKVFFFGKDFSTCRCGDIVSVEFIKASQFVISKTKVTWIGKI